MLWVARGHNLLVVQISTCPKEGMWKHSVLSHWQPVAQHCWQSCSGADMPLPLLQPTLQTGTAPQFPCNPPIITPHCCKNSVPVSTEKLIIKTNKCWGRWLTVHTFSVNTCKTGGYKRASTCCFRDMRICSLPKGLTYCLGNWHKTLWDDFYSRPNHGPCFSQACLSWKIWHISVCIYWNLMATLETSVWRLSKYSFNTASCHPLNDLKRKLYIYKQNLNGKDVQKNVQWCCHDNNESQ